ncbi:MAG: ATP-binding cassette domain-containing protein [bacterium]|nr:ATP-binding cassette domain-containing protein [bacterium]
MINNKEIIQVKNLVRNFGKIKAVDGISFSVKEGEFFGFLGPNGAGKTTTMRIICTLLAPTSGQVKINGYDVVKNPDGVRRSIGMVFQEESLDEKLTAWENLKFHAILYDIPSSQQSSRIIEVLEMAGLVGRKDDLVNTFSGGMKRRLEIARGLLHRPRVLFLDEPTMGLDPQTRRHIWDYIQDLRIKESITVFLTTHYMDEAELVDRVGIIDNGKIIALDTVANLKKQVGGVSNHLTLDDVFLALTGWQIREEAASDKDRMGRENRQRKSLNNNHKN